MRGGRDVDEVWKTRDEGGRKGWECGSGGEDCIEEGKKGDKGDW